MDNTRVVEKVFEKAIKKWSEKDQIDFLKVYPIFKFRDKIVDLWIIIYNKINILYNKKHDKEIKRNTLRRSITMTNDGVLKYIQYRKNTINFLEIALKKGFIILLPVEIAKIDAVIKHYNTNLNIIVLMNFYTVYYQNLNKIYPPPITPQSDNIVQLINLEAKDIADQITVYCSEFYQNITLHELLFRAMNDNFTDKDCPNLTKLTNQFNIYINWIPTEIIFNCNDNQQRIQVIKKFINIAIELKKLKNYHMFFAIVGGLNHMSVQRIKAVWQTDAEHTKQFIDLEKIITNLNNYYYYQQDIKDIKDETIIPFFGLIIKELKHLLEPPIIYKKKFNQIQYNLIIAYIKKFELYNKCYNIQKKIPIIAYLMNLSVCTDDDKFFNKSTEIRDNVRMITKSLDQIPSIPLDAIPAKAKLVRATSDAAISSSRKDVIQIDRPLPHNIATPGTLRRPRSLSISSQDIRNCDWILTIQKKDIVDNQIRMESWSNDQVLTWLESIGFSQYKDLFKQHDITGKELIDFNHNILDKMGIMKIGHQMKLLREINNSKHGT